MSPFVSLSVYCRESLCLCVYGLSVSLSAMSLFVMSMSVSLIVRKCIGDVWFLGCLDVWYVGVLVRCSVLLVWFWCEVVCLVVLCSRVCLLQ